MKASNSIQELQKSIVNNEITDKVQKLLQLLNQLSDTLDQIGLSIDDLVVWLAPVSSINLTDETQEILGKLWDKCQSTSTEPITYLTYLARLIHNKQ